MRVAIACALAMVTLSACHEVTNAATSNDPCGIERVLDDGLATDALQACAARGDARAQAYLAGVHWSASSARFGSNEDWGLDATLSGEQLQSEGRRLMESAVARENAEAQNELGLAHLEGLYGVPRDPDRAFNLLTLADARGDSLAPYNLARMHHAGVGAPQSSLQAELFLWRSASRGYQPALCTLAWLRENRGARWTARALRIAARALDDGYSCSFEHSDLADEFRHAHH